MPTVAVWVGGRGSYTSVYRDNAPAGVAGGWPTTRSPSDPARRPSSGHHPRVELVQEGPDPKRVRLPIAPNELDNDGLAPDYEQTGTSPGGLPRLVRSKENLHTIRVAARLVWRDEQWPPEEVLYVLRAMARETRRVRVAYGPSEQGWFRIGNLGWQVTVRAEGNAVGEAVATFDLVRAWHPDPAYAPPADRAVAPPAAPAPAAQPAKVRTVTVTAGDTAASLSTRVYGTPDRGNTLLDFNGVQDPRNLTAGLILKVPA